MQNLIQSRLRRARRTRAKIAELKIVRLTVHRTNSHIYAQVIDDKSGATVASASSIDKDVRGKLKTGASVEAATAVGKVVAERAKKAGVDTVVFDRGGYLYHGRVKALAEAAREGGLSF